MANDKIALGVFGKDGKMAKTIIALSEQDSDVYLNKVIVAKNSTIDDIKLPITDNLATAAKDLQVAIDFTLPNVTIDNLPTCVEFSLPLVIGTTGFDSQQLSAIKTAADKIPIVLAANMSVGVNVLYKLLEVAALAIGNDADIEIIEAHHKHKQDAPSGTALAMGEVIAKNLQKDLNSIAEFSRNTNKTRKTGDIGFSSIRAGEIIGEHTALFALANERIEITHKAHDRTIFAKGAIKAAKWLVGKSPGLYTMQDVLFK